MITRKLGGLLRGKATPFQLLAACVLGSLLGFAPAPTQAPALYVLLLATLLVVNANLGLALLVAGGTRLLSLVAVSVSFEVGRFLLDGPTSGLASTIVNAPVLAWCGFEYYAVAGGQAVGLVVGVAAGLVITRTLGAFRRKMVAARDNPTRLRELSSKPGARFLMWMFFGSTGKRSWEQKLAKRVGNPVRIWGAALVAAVLAGAYFAQQALAGPLARRGLQAGLESANGATVDVGGVELDLGGGKLAVSALAMADPSALDQDLFRAAHLELDVDATDLLRKRMHVARLVVREARSGAPRETRGERTAPAPEEVDEEVDDGSETFSLEEVLTEAKVWKERLAQTRRWIDRLAGATASDEEADEEEGGAGDAGGESLEERLAREVKERGWLRVRAGHLVDGAPTLRLSELVVDGLEVSHLPGRTLDLHGSDLSTHPRLVDAPPRVELSSRDGALGFLVDLAPASRAGGDGALRFHWKGLAVDDVMTQLRIPGGAPFQGGTLDVEIDGAWDQGRIGRVNLPLRATLHDTIFRMQGVEPTPLERLELAIGLEGPIEAPRIRFDSTALTDALVAAGKKELARRVQGELAGRLEELGELDQVKQLEERIDVDLPDGIGEKLPDAKEKLEGLFGRRKGGT